MDTNGTSIANTFRIKFTEDVLGLDFGFRDRDESENIELINSVDIDIKIVMPLIERLIISAALYQKKYNVDLGLEADIRLKEEGE